jgi:sarcosine oxidase subunit alpha
MSGGWTPTLHLTSHQGGRPRWDEKLAAFVADQLPPGMQVAGAANGELSTAEALGAGMRAGAAAAEAIGLRPRDFAVPAVEQEGSARRPLWRVSISRTTSRPPTSSSPSAKASARSST